MKKILSILLLTNLFVSSLYADEETILTIQYNYSVAPSFSILIPKSIDISNTTSSFRYSIKGDLYYDQTLHVDFDSSCIISSINDSNTIYVQVEKSSWTQQELTNDYVSSNVTLTHEKLSSGSWSGKLHIKIHLEEGAS